MKTTVDISDELFQRSRRMAGQRNTTMRALIEDGLRRMLDETETSARRRFQLRAVKTRGGGLQPSFDHAGWGALRDEIYRGRGA